MSSQTPHNDQEMPLVAHLTELRTRLLRCVGAVFFFFFFNDTATPEIYTLVSEPLRRFLPEGATMIAIDPASINFGHTKMEEHARGKDFFNAEAFPKITYKGRIAKWNGDAPAAVEGEMTLLGVTKPLNLQIHSFKCIQHPMLKREVCGADAAGAFKRSDFGMKYGLPAHGDDMKVAIQIEAIKAD